MGWTRAGRWAGRASGGGFGWAAACRASWALDHMRAPEPLMTLPQKGLGPPSARDVKFASFESLVGLSEPV